VPANRISAAEAAERLGVERATLYAYVSRGILGRDRAADGKTSLFDPVEVDRLMRGRGRRRNRAVRSGLDIAISTGLTRIDADGPWFRGKRAADLAEDWAFERVAEWIWTGTDVVAPRWPQRSGLRSGLGLGGEPSGHLAALVLQLAESDALRNDLRSDAVVNVGRRLIAAAPDAVPGGRAAPRGARVAERLWWRVAGRPPRRGELEVLEGALVLLADHDLAASTLAARVAASVRADPYSVVLAGLATLAGPLHGGASRGVHDLFTKAEEVGAAQAVGEVLRNGDRLPGFGHRVYIAEDPRCTALLRQLRRADLPAAKRRVIDEVAKVTSERLTVFANVDYAIGAFSYAGGLGRGTGEWIFGITRMVGWLGHAIEEYGEAPARFRPLGRYTGVR
jgi:citrate synthase